MPDQSSVRGLDVLLTRTIDVGIEAANADYARPEQRPKREGSVAGFEACRGKTPNELADLLTKAREATFRAYTADQDPENYWWARCYELEVEWVCNVISAALMNSGLPVIITPTVRGIAMAASILGVDE